MSTPGPCASSDERDTQDILPEEPHREHDTQDTPARSLETRNPTHPGGTRRGVQWLWASLAGLTALELHHRRSTVHAMLTKNEVK